MYCVIGVGSQVFWFIHVWQTLEAYTYHTLQTTAQCTAQSSGLSRTPLSTPQYVGFLRGFLWFQAAYEIMNFDLKFNFLNENSAI